MGLDIRLPIGLMFAILGLLLFVYGVVSDPQIYSRSLGINVNFWWGGVLVVFGLVMFMLGRRGTSAMRPAEAAPEGRATERREREKGLESD